MYEKLTDLNVLYDAFEACRRGVGWKCSTQRYEANVLANICALWNALESGMYQQKRFVEFDINERGKPRHIKSPHISDRVLQRALCDVVLNPALKPYLAYDNAASVKGKGIDFSRRRLQCHLEKYCRRYGAAGYVMTVDFSHFFDSIPHDKLLEAFGRKLDDERLMKLLRLLVKSFDTGDGRGLGIGSQLSQIAGIFYLTPVDNYCKIVSGCKYYGRYMDDLYVIHESKAFLKDLLHGIAEQAEKLGLALNQRKTQIQKIEKGFTFLKVRYRVTETGHIVKRLCKANIVRERRKLKKLKVKLS